MAAGASVGAGIGGALGAAGGPAGIVAGAVAGALAGGLVGRVGDESIDPTFESGYWRANFGSRPADRSDRPYEDFEPAYRYGWESYSKYLGRSFDDVERQLEQGWGEEDAHRHLPWGTARSAVRDAWDRVKSA